MKKFIVIKTQFEALHNWEGCTIKEVMFLSSPHRHIFHVVVKWQVSHNDREREFICWKRKVNAYIKRKFEGKFLKNKSCEAMAEELIKKFEACYVSVFEDNENGAEVVSHDI